jgi:hypothetical protein
MGSAVLTGMLLMADMISIFKPTMMVKIAFKLGSSKQGNARRALGASICDTAKYVDGNQVSLDCMLPFLALTIFVSQLHLMETYGKC